ncbi:MAG: hypothetical protein IKZ51_04075 [Bacteroidales bacterium]|nr:hypothetical protein [Bacteroidales bacterium]
MKKNLLICLGIVLGFLVLSYAFVPQLLEGKIVNQSDISGWQGMSHEKLEWDRAHPGDPAAWTGSMFSGMPTTTIQASTKGDWTQKIYDFLLIGKRPATYLFISLLGAFLLLLAFGVNPLIAAFGAIAVTFCSYNIQIIQVGHNTKMQALAFAPWVLAAIVYTYRVASGGRACNPENFALRAHPSQPGGWAPPSNVSEGGHGSRDYKPSLRWPAILLGAALFGLALSFQIKANHPQISYYLAIMIIIYVAVLLVSLLKRKQSLKGFWVASALLLATGLAGIGTNAIKLLPTWEYTPYSMRGGTTAKSADDGGARKGLDIDYATAWSYGWEELPNLAIPNYNGGASSGPLGMDSETVQLLKRAGQTNLKQVSKHLPTYWGPQPFTAGPMYMGAVTIFLFILGLCWFKGRECWWAVIASLLAVLLALGSHFLWFTKLFYDWVPLYNKFRTVSMALVVLQFTLPVLGFLMLDGIVRDASGSKVLRRKVLISGGVSLGLLLLLALLQSMFGSFTGAADAGQPEILTNALAADRYHLLWADTLRSMLLVAAAALVLVWGAGAQVAGGRRMVGAVLVGVLVLADLFLIGKRYLGPDDFVSPKAFQSQFDKRPVDEMILADKDPSYRVLDLTVNVFNDSHPSYWHKNIGGYSPAKLQRYQEYIDARIVPDISRLSRAISGAATVGEAEDLLPYLESLASLNCRYIIVGEDNPPLAYKYARGNAWFENQAAGDITLDVYTPDKLEYSYSSAEGGLAVFSEVYYPAGWVARLEDGTELPVELYGGGSDELGPVAGGVLRCIDLPAGEHHLTMSFEPKSYSRGEAISRACSILLILLVLGSAAGYFAAAKAR